MNKSKYLIMTSARLMSEIDLVTAQTLQKVNNKAPYSLE